MQPKSLDRSSLINLALQEHSPAFPERHRQGLGAALRVLLQAVLRAHGQSRGAKPRGKAWPGSSSGGSQQRLREASCSLPLGCGPGDSPLPRQRALLGRLSAGGGSGLSRLCSAAPRDEGSEGCQPPPSASAAALCREAPFRGFIRPCNTVNLPRPLCLIFG